jgi:hypothetical protein
MNRRLLAACAALCLAATTAPPAAFSAAPDTWDNLVKVKSKRLDAVYLLPDADFKPYTKVWLEPPEVAFQKNWLRDYNSSATGLAGRISNKEAEEALVKVRDGFQKVFTKAYTDAGYQIVDGPGPDVIKLRTAVINLKVNAPERNYAGRSRSYAPEAGGATLVLEARDSDTGAILGRAVDSRLAGDMGAFIRNSVTNQADFEQLFRTWAKASVNGLNVLKSGSEPQLAKK